MIDELIAQEHNISDPQTPEKIYLHRSGIWNENKEDGEDVSYIREDIVQPLRDRADELMKIEGVLKTLLYDLASHANSLARETALWKSDNDHAERVINLSTDALVLLSNEVLMEMHKDGFNPSKLIGIDE